MQNLLASLLLALTSTFAQSAPNVTVTTDNSLYAPGDPIEVTIANNGPDRTTRGGLACDDLWPLALEQQDQDGNWQPVAVPRHNCIGVTGTLASPGVTQTRTITLTLDPGIYHVAYAYTDVDAGTQQVAVSDPFQIDP